MRGVSSPTSLLMDSSEMNSLNGSLPLKRLKTPQPYSNPRLDIYPSLRKQTPYRELKFHSHMGPGYYDFHDYTNRFLLLMKDNFIILNNN